MFKRVLILIPLLCGFFLAGGCGKKDDASKKQEAIPVKVIKVELQDIQKTLDYVGSVSAQDEAKVYPKVGGKIIEKVKNDGDSVAKGDIIAYIDRDEVGFTFEKAPVESPMDGIVGRVYVDIGTSVNPQAPVALVVNMDKVKVVLNIPEEYLPKIMVGQTAQINLKAYPGESFSGTVTRVSPVLDTQTRSAPIEISIPNDDHRLKSGMFARVKLVLEEHKQVPVIIKESIMGKAPELYVYVTDGNAVQRKTITLGIRQGALFEVTQGLKEGEQVVVMGQQRLYDGAPVNVETNGNQEATVQ